MSTPTTAELAQMREWLADCTWSNVSAEDVEDRDLVPDEDVLANVARHYAGGIAAFIEEMA